MRHATAHDASVLRSTVSLINGTYDATGGPSLFGVSMPYHSWREWTSLKASIWDLPRREIVAPIN